MHKSAYEIGAKFLERYWSVGMANVLEVGAFDVNGSLRDFKPQGCDWTGVDLEPGKGVDLVIERASTLPFKDDSFDLVVATSIFEHDPTFWLTFNEMVRVVKPSGFIYVCAPSNGWVHRYPMDVYRFYPDAGIGLVEWGQRTFSDLQLVESFISERDGDIWNDFCAVFSKQKNYHVEKIYVDTQCTNVWSDGKFLENTLVEATEDMRLIEKLGEEVKSSNQENSSYIETREMEPLEIKLKDEISELRNLLTLLNDQLEQTTTERVNISSQLHLIQNSISWRITNPLRILKSWVFRC